MYRYLALAAIVLGVVAPTALAQEMPTQPSAIERLMHQEDARRNDPRLGITYSSASQPTAIERLARPEFDGPPDALDRYRVNPADLDETLVLGGSPDAIDRFRTNDGSLTSTLALGGAPDAIDRYRAANEAVLRTPAIEVSPDALDRYTGRTLVVSAPNGSGFNWDDFGIGAAAMLATVVILVGAAIGLQAARHRADAVRPS